MTSKFLNDIIKLNVGGVKYETTLNTITSDSDSMLANMFSGRHLMKPDNEGYHFIDRDRDIFKYIIKFLRDKTVNLDSIDVAVVKNIRDEAEYFQINGLIDICDQPISTNTLNLTFEICPDDIKKFESDFNRAFNLEYLFKYPHRDLLEKMNIKDYFLTNKYYEKNDDSVYQLYIYYSSNDTYKLDKYTNKYTNNQFILYEDIFLEFIKKWRYHLLYLITFDKTHLNTLFNNAINSSDPSYFTKLPKNFITQVSCKCDKFALLKNELEVEYWFELEFNILPCK
jgi:hypothetical protein